MAKLITTLGGFKVIMVESGELKKVDCCDCCLKKDSTYFYIPVLDKWLCAECYRDWLEKSVRTEGDDYIETRNINKYKNLLKEL